MPSDVDDYPRMKFSLGMGYGPEGDHHDRTDGTHFHWHVGQGLKTIADPKLILSSPRVNSITNAEEHNSTPIGKQHLTNS
jgi:hypothetical protein